VNVTELPHDLGAVPPRKVAPVVRLVVVDTSRATPGGPPYMVEFSYAYPNGGQMMFSWAITDSAVFEMVKNEYDGTDDDMERARRILDLSPLGRWS
jgi:hypothetical protein